MEIDRWRSAVAWELMQKLSPDRRVHNLWGSWPQSQRTDATPNEDYHGWQTINSRDHRRKFRSKLSHFYFADAIQPPTRAELDEAHANGDHGDHDETVEGVTGTVELEKS
jgi:hypothetical protein